MAITRFQDVTQAALQVVLESLEIEQSTYQTLFPADFTANLTWESLSADGNFTIAADVIAHNASAKLKRRPDTILETGRIPKIALLNEVDEDALHKLFALRNAPRGLEDQIFQIIFGDVGRAYRGVHMRLEHLAMTGLSTGVAEVTAANNLGTPVSGTFNIPGANQTGASVTWTSPSTAKPLDDLKAMVKQGKDAGFPITQFLMDEYSFDLLRATDQVINTYSGFLGLSAGLLAPTVDNINIVLSGQSLPPIKIIDSRVTHETKNGTFTTINPWSEGKIVGLSSNTAGRTQFTLTAEEKSYEETATAALAANRDIVRITRWSDVNPFKVFTKGEAVAFPVLGNVTGIFQKNVKATSWS